MFSAIASDAEDGDLSDAIVWTSNVDGQLGTGGNLSWSDLSIGTHTITASFTDSGGQSGSDSVTIDIMVPPNTLPTISVQFPNPGDTFNLGDVVTFTATASDAEDGDLSATLNWYRYSRARGQLVGTGASVAISDLGVGYHYIAVLVNDSAGTSATKGIRIQIVEAAGSASNGFIDSLGKEIVSAESEVELFSTNAPDEVDGTLNDATVWPLSIQEYLSEGSPIRLSGLNNGSHPVMVSVTDNTDERRSASLPILTIGQ